MINDHLHAETHFPDSGVIRVRIADPQTAAVHGAGDGDPRLVLALPGLAPLSSAGAALEVHVVAGGLVHVVRSGVDEEAAVELGVRVAVDVDHLARPGGGLPVGDLWGVHCTALERRRHWTFSTTI